MSTGQADLPGAQRRHDSGPRLEATRQLPVWKPPRVISRRQLLALGAVSVIAAACSDDNRSDATTPASSAPPEATDPPTPATAPATTSTVAETTTTISPADLANAYSEAGPFPVGVLTTALASGSAVEIWYPAVAGTGTSVDGEVVYDARDFVPPAIKGLLTADIPASFAFDGARDADVADGTFPVLLFSHGFTGFRLQSTFLTAHLASWGYVVVAPDHPSRDMFNVLGGTASGDGTSSVTELLAALDLALADPVVGSHVDATRVAAIGHSAGGGTVLGAAADPRIAGYVSMASGAFGAASDAPLPDRPSFFLSGALDAIAPLATATQPAFDAAPAPALLWVLDGVGHNGFDDFCTFGGGTGIIGVAEASGLGAVLDANPNLRKLGEDGCLAPAAPVTETFPVIRHAVTAWVRQLFGTDAEPVGLGAEVADQYVVAVTISQRD